MTGDLNTTLGPSPIYICGEAATLIPNSSFEQNFHPQSKGSTSHGLTPKLPLDLPFQSAYNNKSYVKARMKTFRMDLMHRELSDGGRRALGLRMDHFRAAGKKSPDGTSLIVPSGHKVMRVVPREINSRPLSGGNFLFWSFV